jgi:hypothetical protein
MRDVGGRLSAASHTFGCVVAYGSTTSVQTYVPGVTGLNVNA